MQIQTALNVDPKEFVPKDFDNEIVLHTILTDKLAQKGYYIGAKNAIEMTTEEFVQSRTNTFGASDAAVLLKVAYSSARVRMKTIEELIQEKVTNSFDESISKKASVRKGKNLEDYIIGRLENIFDTKIIKPAHMYIDHKGLATNFDGIIFKNIIKNNIVEDLQPIPFEVKLCTMYARKNYHWGVGSREFQPNPQLPIMPRIIPPKTSSIAEHIKYMAKHYGIPAYYYTQIQQQILFLNAPYGYVGVMDDNEWEVFTFHIPRDEKTIKALRVASAIAYGILCKRKGIEIIELNIQI